MRGLVKGRIQTYYPWASRSASGGTSGSEMPRRRAVAAAVPAAWPNASIVRLSRQLDAAGERVRLSAPLVVAAVAIERVDCDRAGDAF